MKLWEQKTEFLQQGLVAVWTNFKVIRNFKICKTKNAFPCNVNYNVFALKIWMYFAQLLQYQSFEKIVPTSNIIPLSWFQEVHLQMLMSNLQWKAAYKARGPL